MCDKCKELDDKIKHYRRIAASINDQLTIDRIGELVARLEAEKTLSTQSRNKAERSSAKVPAKLGRDGRQL
jgi:hypothetical protein